MSTQVAIREYRPDDELPILALLNRVLGTDRAFERSSAFFRWKHFENPFGPSLMLVADGQEILGLRAFLRWQFKIGRNAVQAVRAVDTATHPGYQRMGVFSRLTSACLERARADGVRFVFNTPNDVSLRGYLKLGWTYVGRMTVMVRPLRPLRMIWSLLPSRRDGQATEPRVQHEPARTIDDLLALGDAVRDLLSRDDAGLTAGFRTARSVEFLRWRYARVPSLRYGTHWVGDGMPRAAAIYRLNRRWGLSELMISELFFEDGAAGRRVLRELCGLVQADYAVAHCAWSTPHRRVFLTEGFVPLPRRGPHFTVRPLAPTDEAYDPRTAGRWRLALGDVEIF